MLFEKNQDKFNTWALVMKNFIESKDMDNIFIFLKKEVQSGKKIVPVAADLFMPFYLTNRFKLKAIMVFSDPYTMLDKEGIPVANGIPLSSNDGIMYPQMEVWHQSLEEYLGFDPTHDLRVNLSYLMYEENILLINQNLTCEVGKAGSHAVIWEPFMKYFFESIINTWFSNLPIVLCGKSTHKLERYIAPMVHHVLKIEGPEMSVGARPWNTQNCFKFIDKIVEVNNGIECIPRWYRKKEEKTTEQVNRERRENLIRYTDKEYPNSDLPW